MRLEVQGKMVENIGEAICISGVLVAVAITGNYWLLGFTILPVITWASIDKEVKAKNNSFYYKKQELVLEQLREEIRLLKARKK